MDYRQFLATAQRLAQGTTEGDWRSAASRAYYAVFHFFREWFLTRGIDIGQGSQAHNTLYLALHNCGEAAVRVIGRRVNDLRRTRTRADYDFGVAVPASSAPHWTAEAAAIIADYRNVLATVPAQNIVDGARAYLRSIGRIP